MEALAVLLLIELAATAVGAEAASEAEAEAVAHLPALVEAAFLFYYSMAGLVLQAMVNLERLELGLVVVLVEAQLEA